MKNRTSLYNLKNRMSINIWEVDKEDLPMIVKWLFELEAELENLKREKYDEKRCLDKMLNERIMMTREESLIKVVEYMINGNTIKYLLPQEEKILSDLYLENLLQEMGVG